MRTCSGACAAPCGAPAARAGTWTRTGAITRCGPASPSPTGATRAVSISPTTASSAQTLDDLRQAVGLGDEIDVVDIAVRAHGLGRVAGSEDDLQPRVLGARG